MAGKRIKKVSLIEIQAELQEGIKLAKCRKCGCMKDTLENLRFSFSPVQAEGSPDLPKNMESWLKQMEMIKYACLGCKHCFPAVAWNMFNQAFPEATQKQSLSCASEAKEQGLPPVTQAIFATLSSFNETWEEKEQAWPPVAGEYFVLGDGPELPVAVSTLSSVELAESLAQKRPEGLCLVGKTETENIGIDKLVKNTITNPNLRFLLLCGRDPRGHHSGKTLFCLWEKGIDENLRVVGSPGRYPFLRNVTPEEVEAFRGQVQVVDLMGCEEENRIIGKIQEISQAVKSSGICEECAAGATPIPIATAPIIRAEEPQKTEMDKAGYFVVIPQPEKKIITVEHYSYDNKLLRIIEGESARSVYWTIIQNGWITQLSHAAYLGKELAKAELSLKLGFKYVQDGA